MGLLYHHIVRLSMTNIRLRRTFILRTKNTTLPAAHFVYFDRRPVCFLWKNKCFFTADTLRWRKQKIPGQFFVPGSIKNIRLLIKLALGVEDCTQGMTSHHMVVVTFHS